MRIATERAVSMTASMDISEAGNITWHRGIICGGFHLRYGSNDFEPMQAIHAALTRDGTCGNSDVCDFKIHIE